VEARNKVKLTLLLGQMPSVRKRSRKILAMLNNLSAKRAHGGILCGTVTSGYNYHRLQTPLARGESDALPMVSSGSGKQAIDLRLHDQKFVYVNEASPYFKCSERSVVLMLDPHFAARALA
jgi:hypothetical protein